MATDRYASEQDRRRGLCPSIDERLKTLRTWGVVPDPLRDDGPGGQTDRRRNGCHRSQLLVHRKK